MSTWLIIVVTATASYLLSLVVRVLTSREKKIAHEIKHLFSVADDQFLRSMGGLLPPAVLSGNRITALANGDEFFPAMLKAIGSARHSVTFETFIYWQGQIGRRLADALIDRARAGVKVHVLLDWLGTKKMDPQSVQSFKDAGVEVERYHPRDGTTSVVLTTGRTASSSLWTERSASRAGQALPTSGGGVPKTPITGATRISRSKDRWLLSANRPS